MSEPDKPRERGDIIERAGRHFSGGDADPNDMAEIWGRRVGRALSVIACVILVIMLIRQLRG